MDIYTTFTGKIVDEWKNKTRSFCCRITIRCYFLLSSVSLFVRVPAKADPAPVRRARAPLFEIFYWCIFGNFNSLLSINFIVINMQCLQYVFYSLLSLQEHRVCVKGHQNNLQTSKTIPRRDRAPGS